MGNHWLITLLMLSFGLLSMMQSPASQPKPLETTLAEKKDKRRILLFFGSATSEPSLVAQQEMLSKVKNDLSERDLDVVVVTAPNVSEDDQQFLRIKFKMKPTATFVGWLIGKDGGVKQTYQKPIPPAELFRLIDSMPMRKLEMKN
ncbi:DUF4174 domain-containing protein [Spirosoma sp. BT702]|uniref:DUF4174 domain-containing protein n=1 Tax=Spirosoma profusum TaxID=2771354 RepID=A0A927AQP5_9BACT|nr:DUF4174 domain-containing protein [Spirosoma profusum]MBD2700886.1 DUF4174 domain-containing protein [Spirosoma profusum]